MRLYWRSKLVGELAKRRFNVKYAKYVASKVAIQKGADVARLRDQKGFT